jgi:hypothetical protein
VNSNITIRVGTFFVNSSLYGGEILLDHIKYFNNSTRRPNESDFCLKRDRTNDI